MVASDIDLADVRGHERAKRALEIAAAGNHGLLLVGPPGSGRTMLARRLTTIMPPLTDAEVAETSRIRNVAGLFLGNIDRTRPFRAPHHTVSTVGLLGGGAPMRPGEVSLAHLGVLFLDELTEFRRGALSELAGVLNVGHVAMYRRGERTVYPAAPLLVGAANVCCCGRCSTVSECPCSPEGQAGYQRRLGSLMATLPFDMVVYLERLSCDAMADESPREPSAVVRERVTRAHEKHAGKTPAERIALTIARLAGADEPTPEHEAEAVALANGLG